MLRSLWFKKISILFFLILALGGLFGSVFMIYDYFSAKDWNESVAIVDDTKIEYTTTESQGVTKYNYRLYVKYHYDVDEVTYQTGFKRYGNSPKRSSKSWLDLVDRQGIYKGAEIPVWINPNDVSNSRLVIEDSSIIMYWVSVLFFSLCLYGIWMRIKELFFI